MSPPAREEPLIKRLARSRAMHNTNHSRDASLSPSRDSARSSHPSAQLIMIHFLEGCVVDQESCSQVIVGFERGTFLRAY
jgi:hypothetical protein